MDNLKRFLITVIRRPVYYIVCLMTRIQKRKIVFSNFNGSLYGCNPKYLCERLRMADEKYDLVWIVKRTELVRPDSFPSDVRVTRMGTLRYYFDLATAEFWISNTLRPQSGFSKRNGQYYIQTGHGSFGIKKIGLDTTAEDEERLSVIRKDASSLDFFLSHSSFETEIYSRAFMYEGKVQEVGHARNDVLFSDPEPIRKKIRQWYSLDEDLKILLYMPTFKGQDEVGSYLNKFSELETVLANRFGGQWKVVLRLHPRSKNQITRIREREDSGFVDATLYPDIQELMVAADAAITDFSSAIFDFILQKKKPAFVYAPSVDRYMDTTGTYFTIGESPMPLSRNVEELFQQIDEFDDLEYQSSVARFIDSMGSVEDGQATERAVRIIESLTQYGAVVKSSASPDLREEAHSS